jgi:hypothetical protein
VIVGDARQDGHDRLYLLNPNAKILEYDFRGRSAWERTAIPAPSTGALLGVFPAHAGQKALYALKAGRYSDQGQLQELHLEGGRWGWEPVADVGENSETQCAAGDVRGDGVVRIYCVGIIGELSETSHTGSEWTSTRVVIERPDANALSTIAVGPGRGDGRNRIYIQRFDDDLVELTYLP